MTSGTDILDAVVIGAGWAGLGVSHALTQRGLRHRVLERGRIGRLGGPSAGSWHSLACVGRPLPARACRLLMRMPDGAKHHLFYENEPPPGDLA